jgi:hypothetical protein
MIRKLKSGEYRLYSRNPDPRTGRRRNLGTFRTRSAAERHERAVQFFNAAGEHSARTRRYRLGATVFTMSAIASMTTCG